MNSFMRACINSILFTVLLAACGCGENKAKSESAKPVSAAAASVTTVSVAAASDLKYAFDELIVAFKKANPNIDVQPTYGSSGNFFSQLSNQAPFDIYFSADIQYPRKLIEQGLAGKETEFMYAVGQIVVWVRNDSPLDLEDLGMHVLLEPVVQKIAIANPQHAPYGRAAEAAMKTLNVYESVKDRLVLGENIAQTAQFIESGAADVGIIALSLAMAPAMKEKGRYWVVPLDAYPRLEQGGVILNWVKNREATELLRKFVIGDQGRAILQRYGFLLPGE